MDAAERPLPDLAARFASDTGAGARWEIALSIMSRPWSLPELIRLSGAASAARNSLAVFAEDFLRAWPRPASEPPRNMSVTETRKSQ